MIVKKAWQIDLSRVYEGYLHSSDIKYAETRGKAKAQYCLYDYWVDKHDTYTYLNLPVIRCKEADKYEFEGEYKTKWQIEEIAQKRKKVVKLENMLEDKSITHCYIKKGGYYRPGGAGYTDFRTRAGVFTIQEGVSSAKSCGELYIIPIVVEEHNKIILEEIKDLKTRLI
mgnify:CR=1 FL=1